MVHYLTINTIFESVCLLTALIALCNDRSRVWKSMIIYLSLVCTTEFTGIYIKSFHRPNSWIYNLLTVFEAGFILCFFYRLMVRYTFNRYLISGGGLLLFIVFTIELIRHGIFKRNDMTNAVMSIEFVLLSFCYFYYLLKEEPYLELGRLPEFWWVSGTLFFYFGDTACDIFYPVLSRIIQLPDLSFKYIYYFLNILLYSCWSYSFICRKWLIRTSEDM